MKLLKHSRFTTILVTVLSIVAITIATDSTIKTVHANNKRIELKKHKTQALSKVKKLNLKDVRPAVVNKIKDAKSEKDLNTLLTKAYDLSKSNTQYDNDKIKELKETELKKKEEAAKIAKQKAESLKKAENEKIEKEKLEQSAQNAAANTDTNTNTNTAANATANNTAESTPPSSQPQQSKIESSVPSSEPIQPQTTQTDGFNVNGYHFNISSFSGAGHVPADNNVYLWADYTQHPHYLIERMGSASAAIRTADVGTQITINGSTYTVFNVVHGVQNDSNAYNALSNGSPAITIQSCDTANENSVLTIWHAR